MTGASTATCAGCGHVFAPVKLIESGGVKRCLECGLASPATARRCQCGAELDLDPKELREILAERRSSARGMIIGAILVGFLGGLGFLALGLVSFWLSLALIVVVGGMSARMYRKGARLLYAVNATSDDVEGKSEALPQARLRE